MRLSIAIAFAAVLSGAALAASPAAQPLKGFSHDDTMDLSGYFYPRHAVKAGHFQLYAIVFASPDDLKTWEAAKSRKPDDAPINALFQDLTSKHQMDGDSHEEYANSPTVRVAAYRIKNNTVAFTGTDKQLGLVSFTGTVDAGALKTAEDGADSADGKPVLTGNLTVGGKSFKGVAFNWYGGDD